MENSALADLMKEVKSKFEEINRWANELSDSPTTTPYFQDLVIQLLDYMLKQQRNLTIGYQGLTILLALACRNLLELNIFTHHCLMSPKNSKRFWDDQWVDGMDLFTSFKKWMGVNDST